MITKICIAILLIPIWTIGICALPVIGLLALSEKGTSTNDNNHSHTR